MNRADSPKPPVAPKPKTTSPRMPATPPKFSPSPRPESLHSPNSMSRGPKPPIAPKPRLAAPGDCRASVHVNNSVNKCSNGRLPCMDRGLYEGHRATPECSESETDEDYILVPRALPPEDQPGHGSCGDSAAVAEPPDASGEEECEDGGQECGMEGTGAGDDLTSPAAPAEEAPSREAEEDTDQTPEDQDDDCDDDPGTEEQASTSEEEEKRVKAHNMYNLGARGSWGGREVFESDIILTHVDSEAPAALCEEPELPQEAEEDGEDPINAEPRGPHQAVDCDGGPQDSGQDAEDDSEEPSEDQGLATDVQEPETAAVNLETPEEHGDDGTGCRDHGDQEVSPDLDEQTDHGERMAATQEPEEGPEEGEAPVQDEPAEDSCHIVPFESDSADDFVTPLAGSPYAFFPTESTSFCGESFPLAESAKGQGQEPPSWVCAEDEDVPSPGTSCGQHSALHGGAVPDVVVVPVPEDEDATEDSLCNPYVMGVGLTCPGDPGEGQGDTQAVPVAPSAYDTKDAEGGVVPTDRKSVVPRARAHSGKVAGSVPEAVPEEAAAEAGSPATGAGAGEEARRMPPSAEGKPPEAGRALPAKPRGFALHPRSLSVEGREVPEAPALGRRVQGAEDNVSLPGALGSSGSFSRGGRAAGASPCSAAGIPPPFDLACVTRRPVARSSPALLALGDADRAARGKKSSFKRLLALTFRRKADARPHGDASAPGPRAPSECGPRAPRLQPRPGPGQLRACDAPAAGLLRRDGFALGRAVSRVESFEDRARPPFLPLPPAKPRSISFPSAAGSDYENVPAANADYENVQVPPRAAAKLFEDPSAALSAGDNDGYVDMSSFGAFESPRPRAEPDADSAYTEPYKVCPISAAAPREDLTSDEEQGSSEEDSAPRDPSLTRKVEGQSRALVIAQELLSSEKAFLQTLQHLCLDFHAAVMRALDDMDQEGRDILAREELRQGLSELPAIHDLHRSILEELEERLSNWENQQKVADVFLAREQEFDHHAGHILQFDRYLGLLAENCLLSPRLAAAVREFEQSPQGGGQNMKHRLLRVVQRLFQYQVLLTDYLNNLCPDSAEYDDTQGALSLISKVTDRANDSMEQGENLQKLVHIEHSVRGQGDLLQPGREFLKEGTLMKVRSKNRHPRHLFLMSDLLLYTYPQKDGKYRLKSSLAVANMKVSRPVMDGVPYALRIETPESCLMLSASSCAERDEWHSCLSRALPEDYKAQALAAFHHSVEIRDRLGVSLGERPPTLVPVTHVLMCMNCGCDFSLTLRRHHCHACGKIVCRNCSRNKYPLRYLKDRMAKVCDGCFGELKKRGGAIPGPVRERPVSLSFPLSSARFSSGSAFSSVFPATFKKQKKVPSALTEVAASGEGSAISGYLSRCKRGKRHWKKLWFLIKGKVLYTYMASEDKVAMESLPLLGFTIAPEKEEGSSEVGPVFHLYHKKTLFYSFKAENAHSAQRWMAAMEDASVL